VKGEVGPGKIGERACSQRPQPEGRAHTGAREKCEEEAAAETSCHGLTTTLYSQSPVPLSWE